MSVWLSGLRYSCLSCSWVGVGFCYVFFRGFLAIFLCGRIEGLLTRSNLRCLVVRFSDLRMEIVGCVMVLPALYFVACSLGGGVSRLDF